MSPIAHLRGTVQQHGPDWLVLDVGGIGFLVHVPASALLSTPAAGDPLHLHTHLHTSADGPALYGFTTPEELRLFQMLIGVAGIGPRGALSLLSTLGTDALAAAIAGGDVERLTRAPGIGRRTAERLVLELKQRLREYTTLPPRPDGAAEDDAVAALTALGYSRAEAEAALRALPADAVGIAPADKVRLALRYLAQR